MALFCCEHYQNDSTLSCQIETMNALDVAPRIQRNTIETVVDDEGSCNDGKAVGYIISVPNSNMYGAMKKKIVVIASKAKANVTGVEAIASLRVEIVKIMPPIRIARDLPCVVDNQAANAPPAIPAKSHCLPKAFGHLQVSVINGRNRRRPWTTHQD